MHDNIELQGIPIGHQIRQLRNARGWSLAKLAHRAGTSAPSLHRYENGWDRFEVATLRRIATALDAHLEVILVPKASEGDSTPPTEDELLKLISPLFWDHDLEADHIRSNPAWVINRVLMQGDMIQARALRQFFGDERIREAIRARGVDGRTRTYWQAILDEEDDAPQSSRT
jgi:transcriptional regulator with XRE-family HTH domain